MTNPHPDSSRQDRQGRHGTPALTSRPLRPSRENRFSAACLAEAPRKEAFPSPIAHRPSPISQRGSITLVALCFVTVMAIGLASYLAISNQSMKLSNRSYAKDVSKQLAEKGLEVALLALRTNNWDDWSANSTTADWTLSGTTATCTITYPSGSYGTSGMTAQTKIRVDNYNAYNQPSTWNSTTSYKLNDVVGSSGMWYRCIVANTNQAPTVTLGGVSTVNLAYWVPAPIPWTWSSNISYSLYDVVNYNGTWYRSTASSNTSTPGVANWATIPTAAASTPAISLSWNSATTYPAGSFVCSSGTWYRCVTSNTSSAPPNANWSTAAPFISWWWRNGVTYKFNDVVYYNSTWYRCILGHSVSGSWPLPTNTTYWENALSTSWNWSSSDNYNIGDVVYRSSSFYRCIRAHSNQAPPNTTYWSAEPLLSPNWDSGKNYGQFDTVRYQGSWYLSLQPNNSNNRPTAASSNYWAAAPRALTAWDSGKNYSIDDVVSSGGTWYRCKKDTTANEATSNSTYWDVLTGSSGSYALWSSTTNYTAGNYVSYGGVWYKCTTAPTANQSPNNSNFWSASWAQASGNTTGAPVIYAEGTATIPLQVTSAGAQQFATITTQLRATASPASLFPNAVAATGTVTTGGGGTIDSYDASVAAYSSPGSFSATVASNYAAGTGVTISSTDVKGYLAAPSATTSPYAPLYSTGGTVKGAATSGTTSIDLTRISRSPYIPQFDILPAIQHTTLPTTLPADLYLGTPGSPTPSIYYDTSPSIGTNVYVNGPVIWYVNGNLRVNTGDNIYINSTGSLTVYLTNNTTGRLRIESTGGGIINRAPTAANPDPKNLVILGDTTSSSTQYNNYTTAAFTGVIYLPNTTTTTGLTVADGVTTNGAMSAKEITFSGAATVRYDTSLRYATFQGVDTPFQIDQWRELTDTTERANLP